MKPARVFAAVTLVFVMGGCAKSSTDASPSPTGAAATTAASATVKTGTTAKGNVLTNAAGMTLYNFDKDSGGKIACVDACTTAWPPLAFTGSGTPTGADNLGTITRTDGTKQITVNGKPLYTYSGDTKSGDINGDGFAGFWHIAKASAAAAATTAPTSNTAPAATTGSGYGY